MEDELDWVGDRIADGAESLYVREEFIDIFLRRGALNHVIISNGGKSGPDVRFLEEAIEIDIGFEFDAQVVDDHTEVLGVDARDDALACTEGAEERFDGVGAFVVSAELWRLIDEEREATCVDGSLEAFARLNFCAELLDRHGLIRVLRGRRFTWKGCEHDQSIVS